MHDRASLVLGIVIMVLSAWAVISAMQWPMKAALFPLVVGIPVFCLAAAEVLWGLLGARAGSRAADAPPSDAPPLRDTLPGIAWIVGFFAAIVLLGFPIAVALFVFAYLRWQGREGWIYSLMFTSVVWAIFYGVFDRLLHLPFPAGWIPRLLGWG